MPSNRLEQLLAFYEEDPDDAFTRFAIAKEYVKAGVTEQAISFYEQLIEDQPTYTGTYYHLGKLYEEVGQSEEAIATYQQGIQAAREQRNLKDLSELQDALMQAQGFGFDDEDDE
jgi:tetratricopeptide (TPR) repeat protein